ncbi:exosortase A [Roseomonas rosea]|uniref:Exosortase A n=1 Tax=Muricoccus roseus TaxID=198092 RepID=A0A1M6NA59_9PROT|nr:exosortase A [Roseomonas rosea]SHJ92537.1 exosortase A [Roseomonas rosea]
MRAIPATALPPRDLAHRRAWRAAAILLLAGVAALLVLFRAEAAAAWRIWMTSTAYNHGPLVLPIALWLAWARRHRLAEMLPAAAPWAGALLAVPAALAWLAAERMGIMEGRQFAALGLLYALLLAVLGWRVIRAMAAPLAYLVFLIPFGGFAVPMLQSLTARMIGFGLGLTNIPHYVDDLVIEIPEGSFYVAEACAGLRFIIASLAFGALYALVMFRSPGRRLAVMALAVGVPLIANGIRTFGLVMLGHWQGNAAAIEADHVLYGWVFFSIVLLLLILAGLPFREDSKPLAAAAPAPPAAPMPATALLAAALPVLALAIAAPAAAGALEQMGAAPPQAYPMILADAPGCERMAEGSGLRCPGGVLSARLLAFPPRANWGLVAAERRRAYGAAHDEDITFDIRMPGGAWRARQAGDGEETVATAAWLQGRPAGDGLRSRAAQALHALRGGAERPVLAVVTLRRDGPRDAAEQRALLRAVLESQGAALARQAATVSLGRE